ncbi:MAG: tetratricopeptide repeat protein [Pseudomonadota bacterium]
MVETSVTARTRAVGVNATRRPGTTAPLIHQSILLLIPVILVILVYAGTLRYPFIFDDIPNIVDNPAIRLDRLDASGLLQAAFKSPQTRRPVSNVSFAINYRFGGYAVAGYHCVNILVHIVTGMVFYLLAAETLRLIRGAGVEGQRDTAGARGAARDGTDLVALAAATVWMIHPLQIQSVTFIVQRMNSMAAMFYILSMLFYVRSRIASGPWKKTAGFSLAALSGLLAVGSKEIAVTLPFFLLLYEWFFFQNLDPRWLRRQWPWAAFLFAVAVGILFFYLGENPLGRIIGDYWHRDFTVIERLLTQPRVVLFYLSLLAFPRPDRLNLDHDFEISRSLLAPPATMAAIIAVTAIFLLALVSARRHRLLSFALLWFLGNLVIESSVIGLELVFEHRTYLPSMFLILALTAGAARTGFGRRTKAMALGVLVLSLGLWTNERNRVWQDDLTLWQDSAAKSPQKPRPNNKLGVALEKRGRIVEAERQYRHVIALDPAHPYAYANLATVLAMQNRIEEAIDNYQKALILVPENDSARINLGVVLARTGQNEAALANFSRVGPDHPDDYGTAQKNIGLVLITMGQFEAALSHFEKALALSADNAEVLYSMGNALYMAGRIDEAIGRYRTALQYAPDSAEIHHNLGIALMNNGLFEAAVVQFEKASELQPQHLEFRRDLEIARGKAPPEQ